MEMVGVIGTFSRIIFKISLTLLIFEGIVLLWLRPTGTGLGMMLVTMGINGVTVLTSLLCLFLVGRKAQKEKPRTSILDTLERKKQENADE